ncbi:unnamed protein product, partial [Phaeothamnion confervicola]
GHDGAWGDRRRHMAATGGNGVCPRPVLGAGGAVNALAGGRRQLAHLYNAGLRRNRGGAATTLRNLVLGFVARGRRSAGGGGQATGGFGVPTRADLLSPLHLGGLGVRDPALWAMAGQQRMLLRFAAAWKADGPL